MSAEQVPRTAVVSRRYGFTYRIDFLLAILQPFGDNPCHSKYAFLTAL